MLRFALPGLLALIAVAPAADERGTTETGAGTDPGENAEPGVVVGSVLAPVRGAQVISFTMPEAGEATLALYDRHDRLVRICGQLMRLPAGTHQFRWDGCDLWGNLLPAGTALTAKLFRSPGLRAIYEFSVSSPNAIPWPTKPQGTGMDMRTGGWLGDHSTPAAVAVAGERIFISCGMAEYGHAIIAVDAQGRKLWGRGGLAGWNGPTQMASDGKNVVALQGNEIWRISGADYETARMGVVTSGKPRLIAAASGHALVVADDAAAMKNPLRQSRAKINTAVGEPQVISGAAPTEFNLSPQDAFRSVFSGSGWHRDTRAPMLVRTWGAYLVVAFDEPTTIGTIACERVEGAKAMDAFVLPPGTAFDPAVHQPDPDVADFVPEQWQPLGKTTLTRGLNLLTADKPGMQAQALLIRAFPEKAEDGWKPTLRLARLLERRLTSAAPPGTVRIPADAKPSQDRLPLGDGGTRWDFRAAKPINPVNPTAVVIDHGSDRTFAGIGFLNAINADLAVDRYIGPAGGDPASAPDSAWEQIGLLKGKHDKRDGNLGSAVWANDRWLALDQPATARYLRVRPQAGWQRVRFGGPPNSTEQIDRSACGDVVLVATADVLPEDAAVERQLIERHALAGGTPTVLDAGGRISAIAGAPDGTIYTIVDGRLCRSTPGTDRWTHQPLAERTFTDVRSMTASADRIAVGEQAVGIVLFDRNGKELRTIGKPGRPRGAWDPTCVENPTGLGIAGDGRIWVAEMRFSPKRVARFTQEGACEAEFFGPPMYGGGGALTPDLKQFLYKGALFDVDFAAGTSRLSSLYEKLRSQEGAALEESSFAFTSVEEPLRFQNRLYVVGTGGGVSINLLENGVLRPAAVIAPANSLGFLLRKDCWKEHWSSIDLAGKTVFWNDLNGDGGFQVEEATLHDEKSLPSPIRGGTIGPDLAIWGASWRLAPSRITDRGVPVYRPEEVKTVPMAPTWSRGMTLGGPRSAKPAIGWSLAIASDGSRLREGQPYVQLPDGSFKGEGPLPTPSGWLPPLYGTVMNQPLGFVGTAPTTGPVGDVAVMNGNNGHWYAVSLAHAVVIGAFFTGADGDWGGDLEPRRGIDVTGRKQAWETFFGQFLRADDGRHYVVAGKGWHGISRIEGLNDIRIESFPVVVDPAVTAANTELRAILSAPVDTTGRDPSPRELDAAEVQRRAPDLRIDGRLGEWGGSKKLIAIGPMNGPHGFDIAHDEKGIYVAIAGRSHLGNAATSIKEALRGGFAIELFYRTNVRNRSPVPVAGDRRVVIAPIAGAWTAARYDEVDPEAPADAGVSFRSPWGETRISRVTPIDASQARIAVDQGLLDLDAPIDAIPDADLADLPGAPAAPAVEDDWMPWSAEIFLSWQALGLQGNPGGMRFDIGIRSADPAGTAVAQRIQWADANTAQVRDPSFSTAISPASWGSIRFP